MGKWCLNCGKVMKHSEMTHCSDECILKDVKKSESKRKDGKSIEYWKDESDPPEIIFEKYVCIVCYPTLNLFFFFFICQLKTSEPFNKN